MQNLCMIDGAIHVWVERKCKLARRFFEKLRDRGEGFLLTLFCCAHILAQNY